MRLQAGQQQRKRGERSSVPAVSHERIRALAAAMVRESERAALQGIRLELEQVRCRLAEKPAYDAHIRCRCNRN